MRREPEIGVRYLDTLENVVVTYAGCTESGPWFRRTDDGSVFYCDWHDWYTWGRFKPVTRHGAQRRAGR